MLLFRFDLKSEQKERSQPVKWIQSLEISVLAFYHWLKTIGSFWKNFSSNKTQENNKLKHFLSHYETDIDTVLSVLEHFAATKYKRFMTMCWNYDGVNRDI